jgi:hypothetical protein
MFNVNKKPESITKNLKTSIPLSFKMVFLDRIYIAIAAAVFTTFWIIFSILDQLLYFSPILYFYLPDGFSESRQSRIVLLTNKF